MISKAEIQPSEESPWVIDLRLIEKRAEELQDENLRFSNYLKTLDSEYVDQIVQQISQTVAQQIDCMKCANCCRSLVVAPNYLDISLLAQSLDLETNDFKKVYET